MFNSEFQTVTSSISLTVSMNHIILCATNSHSFLLCSLDNRFAAPKHFLRPTLRRQNIRHLLHAEIHLSHFEIQGRCLPATPAATPKAVDGAKPAVVTSIEIPKEKAPKEGKTPKTKDASKPKDAAKPKEAKVSQSNQLYIQNALVRTHQI
jgi:hypothetical protein